MESTRHAEGPWGTAPGAQCVNSRSAVRRIPQDQGISPAGRAPQIAPEGVTRPRLACATDVRRPALGGTGARRSTLRRSNPSFDQAWPCVVPGTSTSERVAGGSGWRTRTRFCSLAEISASQAPPGHPGGWCHRAARRGRGTNVASPDAGAADSTRCDGVLEQPDMSRSIVRRSRHRRTQPA